MSNINQVKRKLRFAISNIILKIFNEFISFKYAFCFKVEKWYLNPVSRYFETLKNLLTIQLHINCEKFILNSIAFIFLLPFILNTCTFPAWVPKKEYVKSLSNYEWFIDISVFSSYGIVLPLHIEWELELPQCTWE